jgi:hypothetical protein
LQPHTLPDKGRPEFSARNIHYELADKVQGISYGGMGDIKLVVERTGLADAINERLALLKRHLPYYESDHILNIAFNTLCNGDCLDDIERLRNDEVYLNAIGADRIPDPTTAGDFCRRFAHADVVELMDIINQVRRDVWRQQSEDFFGIATIEADGKIAPTTGECKAGMDMSHKGIWGYHPLVVSLANTQEPLYLLNRRGNRPSHEGAAQYLDKAATLCLEAGFQKVRYKGDTDFTQTAHLDRWDSAGKEFLFGIDAMANLVGLADSLGEDRYTVLERPVKYTIKTKPRKKPERVRERIVKERQYKNIRLRSESVAEFEYKPSKCKQRYRVVILRKNLSMERGEQMLFDDIRYFFYITNIRYLSAQEIVFEANKRCNQENLIDQLDNGLHAMRMPLDDLESNWAYMVCASLAWTLKAWFGLLLPDQMASPVAGCSAKESVLKMEFKRFRNYLIQLPCQILRTGRRLVYRILNWNVWHEVLFRAASFLRRPLRC